MKNTFIIARENTAATMLCMLLLLGCEIKGDDPKVSNDLAAMQKIVKLDIPVTSAQWEVFGTPEYTGGVPGPTDYITLIAELTPMDEKAFAAMAPPGKGWIAPASARPWLSNDFRSMLGQQIKSSADMSTLSSCRDLHATVVQTGAAVRGYACKGNGKMLIYLTIADYTTNS